MGICQWNTARVTVDFAKEVTLSLQILFLPILRSDRIASALSLGPWTRALNFIMFTLFLSCGVGSCVVKAYVFGEDYRIENAENVN